MSVFPSVIEVSALDGSNGFRIDGKVSSEFVYPVAGAGEVNGHGFADLIIGAYGLQLRQLAIRVQRTNSTCLSIAGACLPPLRESQACVTLPSRE